MSKFRDVWTYRYQSLSKGYIATKIKATSQEKTQSILNIYNYFGDLHVPEADMWPNDKMTKFAYLDTKLGFNVMYNPDIRDPLDDIFHDLNVANSQCYADLKHGWFIMGSAAGAFLLYELPNVLKDRPPLLTKAQYICLVPRAMKSITLDTLRQRIYVVYADHIMYYAMSGPDPSLEGRWDHPFFECPNERPPQLLAAYGFLIVHGTHLDDKRSVREMVTLWDGTVSPPRLLRSIPQGDRVRKKTAIGQTRLCFLTETLFLIAWFGDDLEIHSLEGGVERKKVSLHRDGCFTGSDYEWTDGPWEEEVPTKLRIDLNDLNHETVLYGPLTEPQGICQSDPQSQKLIWRYDVCPWEDPRRRRTRFFELELKDILKGKATFLPLTNWTVVDYRVGWNGVQLAWWPRNLSVADDYYEKSDHIEAVGHLTIVGQALGETGKRIFTRCQQFWPAARDPSCWAIPCDLYMGENILVMMHRGLCHVIAKNSYENEIIAVQP